MKLNIISALLLTLGSTTAFTSSYKATQRSTQVVLNESDGGMSTYDQQMRAMLAGPAAPVEPAPAPLAPPVVGEVEELTLDEPMLEDEHPAPAGGFGVSLNNFEASREGQFFDKWRQIENGNNLAPSRDPKKISEGGSSGVSRNFFGETREAQFYEKWRTVEKGDGKIPVRDPQDQITGEPRAITKNNFGVTRKDDFFGKWRQVEKGNF